jgi:hypothetical protein
MIFGQALIVPRKRGDKYQTANVFEIVYPLSSLGSLATYIHYIPSYLAHFKENLGDPS